MKRRYFSGSTLEQAVLMAARHHGLEPEELAYRQIEKRHGFLRSRKAFMIAVDPERPRREPGAVRVETAPDSQAPAGEAVSAVTAGDVVETVSLEPPSSVEPPARPQADSMAAPPEDAPRPAAEEPEPEPPAAAEPESEAVPPRAPEPETAARPEPEPQGAPPVEGPAEPAADGELLAAAERAAGTLLRFAGVEGEASARSGPERIEVEIDGPDSSLLVVEDGKGLLAIQHLLPRMLRGLTGRSSFVRVDSREFHRKRKERLEALAQKEAAAATRNGSARTLPPMAPDERRLVHLALRDMPTVVTESRGSGLHKRVVIRPVEEDRENEDVEARHGF